MIDNDTKLTNFSYFAVTAKLIVAGFKIYKESAYDTEIWWNPLTNKQFSIKREIKNISDKTLYDILSQAGVTIDEFLQL